MISRNDYDSFGEIVSSTGLTQNAVTYTGQRLDVESGLMALGNGERYYNPSYGRFIQQDSYAGMPDMPQSLNRFSYAHNNPNKYTDPSGNAVITATLIVAGIILVGTGTYSAKRGNELEAAEQNWAKDDIRTSWGSAFSDGTGMTQAFKGFTGTDAYKGSEDAYKGKPSWHRVWDATIGSLEVIGNATGVSGTLAKGVKVFTNTARVGSQLASAFAKSASRVGRQIGAKAVSIAKQTATIGKRGLRTITTGAKKATESVREMAGKLGNVFEDAFSPQMATPNGVPIRASQVDDVATETRIFSKASDGGSGQKSNLSSYGGSNYTPYGKGDLPEAVLKERLARNDFTGKNYAALKYGSEKANIMVASSDGIHSERLLFKMLGEKITGKKFNSWQDVLKDRKTVEKIKKSVTELYSEREPCGIDYYACDVFVKQFFPNAKVSHTVPYNLPKVRSEGNNRLRRIVKGLKKMFE